MAYLASTHTRATGSLEDLGYGRLANDTMTLKGLSNPNIYNIYFIKLKSSCILFINHTIRSGG